MKKLLYTLLFLQISYSSVAAAPKIEFIYREHNAVFWFLTQLTPNAPTNMTKSIFEASTYNTESNQIKLGYFEKLPIFIDDVDFNSLNEEYYEELRTRYEARNNILNQLTTSEDFNAFKKNSIGLISDQDFSILTKTIETFTPIYNELIYAPNENAFHQEFTGLQKIFQEKRTQVYLEKISVFFHTPLDTVTHFKLVFYPSLDTNDYTIDVSRYILICPLQLKKFQQNQVMAYVITYFIQILFEPYLTDNQEQIYSYFEQNPSSQSRYAYSIFYPSLISILGNGLNFEEQHGVLYQDSKVDTRYSNEIAKLIYPKVIDYLNQDKSLDNKFVDDYISTYQSAFSNWTNDLEFIMLSRTALLSDTSVWKQLNEIYPQTNSSSTMLSETFLSSLDFLTNSENTKVVVINSSHKSYLIGVKNRFIELKDWSYNPMDEFIKIQFLNDRTNLVIINQHNTPLKELLAGYSSK
jgi:hypothetical protein